MAAARSFLRDASGSHWHDYSCTAEGQSAILSSAVPQPHGSAYLSQEVLTDHYRRRTVTFRGELRTERVTGRARLYVRVRTEEPARAVHDHQSTTVSGSRDWASHEVTAQVPAGAIFLQFGVSLTGRGRIQLCSAHLTRRSRPRPRKWQGQQAASPCGGGRGTWPGVTWHHNANRSRVAGDAAPRGDLSRANPPSGRHCWDWTTPGSSNVRPPKNRATSARSRIVPFVEPSRAFNPPGHLDHGGRADVAGGVRDHEIAAGRQPVHQPGEDAARVVGVRDQVQHDQQRTRPEPDDRRARQARLARLAGRAESALGTTPDSKSKSRS